MTAALKKVFAASLVVIICGFSKAQSPYFQNYFLLKKNEQVQINTVFQDKSGFLWFGTSKGLFRFDGINQQRFMAENGLPDDNVTAIAQDSGGIIWTGHKNGNLAVINKGTIKKFNPDEGSASKPVSKILFDKNGVLWFSTLGDGMYFYKENRLYRLDETEKMPDLFVYDIIEDAEGKIWAGTDGGIAVCTLQDKTASIRTINAKSGLPDNIIKKIVPDINGSLWLATEDAGIINYDPTSGKYHPLIAGGWKYGPVTDFLINGNRVWASCPQKGLLVYDRTSEQASVYDQKVNASLTSLNALLKDNQGNIWMGSKTRLLRTPGNHIEFIESLDALKNSNVIALAVDKNENIWFSNSEGLFRRFVDSSGRVSITRQLANAEFQHFNIISLYIDPAQYIWAGLYGDGVVRINPVTGKTQHIKKELKDGNVLNITGKGNVVWLATLGGSTDITILGEQLNIKNYSSENGLISDYIYQCFIDSKDRVWFATDGKGVDMKDGANFYHYTDGLNSKVIYGFAEDGNHHLWANVQGDGLYMFDGAKFVPLSSANTLHDNNVNCLTSDKSGNLVIMHDLGIDIYNYKTSKFHRFAEEAGIRDKVPNLNAVAKDANGRVFLGTDKGIVIYTGMTEQEQAAPVPFIDGLRMLNKNIPLTENLKFKYDENNITVNYSGFWYLNPQNLTFEYKLDNYDKDRIASRNHSVTYSNLPAGNYTFRLKASDTEEFSEAREISFSFIIKPPFWKTTWFYISSVVLICLFIFVFIKYRERKLIKDKKILEEKNAELKKTNMELDRFVYSVSHDLRAPLSSMLGIIDISAEETKEPLQREHLGMLKGNIKRLDSFIQDILNYSRNSRLEIQQEVINFKELLIEITKNLKYIGGNNKEPQINISIEDKSPFYSDKTRISVIMNNLISNAIRYQDPKTEKSVIDIKIETGAVNANIRIQDNGIGISRENHPKIFDMFYRISKNSVGSGLGLYIVKETVDKLKGTVQVESEVGKGSIFVVRLPNNAN